MKRFNQIFTLLLLPIDFLMVWGAFIAAYYVRVDWTTTEVTYIQPIAEYAKFTAELSLLWLAVFFVFGLYRFRGLKTSELLAKVITATSVALALFVIGLFLAKTQFFSRLIVVYFWGISIILIPIGRSLIGFFRQWLQYYGVGVENVWLIAEGNIAVGLREYIKSQRPSQKLLGLSGFFDIETLKSQPQIDRVMLGSELDKDIMLKLIRFCENRGIVLQYVPSLTGLYTSHVTIDMVAGYPLIELAPTPLSGWGRIAKRIFDVVLSILGIVILSPVMLVVAIAVKLDSKGPIIYSQKRVGELGKLFTFYKFRSMYAEMSPGLGGAEADRMLEALRAGSNEASGPMFKMKNDPRVTKVGKFIRKTSLDELPQLFNVFIGNMSVVGPRPALPNEVEQYDAIARRRLLIKPGVTGLWQVSGRSDASFSDYVQLDVYYLEHWSLWLDLKLIFLTFKAVFTRKGSY
jgi:exopolysaccharide biosynthesis polyprenyl glycosylphosphotransferase